MEAIGIIAEYNPFHNGHQLHIKETKKLKDLPVIAVMSGSLMQRGEPAFTDKWLRARMAIEGGVDLVLELPAAFSLRSAQYFAQGGVKLLESTGVVSYLSCGAEDGNVDYRQLAKQMLTSEAQDSIRQSLKNGFSYAKACELALGEGSALAYKPNNILALEYAKALLPTKIEQLIVSRKDKGYNSLELQEISSASAIRKAFIKGSLWEIALPQSSKQLINENLSLIGYNNNLLWNLLQYKLYTSTTEQILDTTECNEGLENLLLASVKATNLEEAIALCSTKRYPASRIRRLFLQLLLGKPRTFYDQTAPAYLRVLAFNDTGRELLNAMKTTATLPIITKLGKNPAEGQSELFKQQLDLDLTASNLVALLRPQQQPLAKDFITSPYYKRKQP